MHVVHRSLCPAKPGYRGTAIISLAAIILLACEAGCTASHPLSTGKIIYDNPSCKYEAYATQDDQGVFEVDKTGAERNLIPEDAVVTGDLTGYFERTIHTQGRDVRVNIQYHATDLKDALRYVKELGC